MDDIFHRPGRKSRGRLIRAGVLFFLALAGLSLVELLRGAPLSLGPGIEADRGEAIFYRLTAAFLSAGLALWLHRIRNRPRRDDGADSLLRSRR